MKNYTVNRKIYLKDILEYVAEYLEIYYETRYIFYDSFDKKPQIPHNSHITTVNISEFKKNYSNSIYPDPENPTGKDDSSYSYSDKLLNIDYEIHEKWSFGKSQSDTRYSMPDKITIIKTVNISIALINRQFILLFEANYKENKSTIFIENNDSKDESTNNLKTKWIPMWESRK